MRTHSQAWLSSDASSRLTFSPLEALFPKDMLSFFKYSIFLDVVEEGLGAWLCRVWDIP